MYLWNPRNSDEYTPVIGATSQEDAERRVVNYFFKKSKNLALAMYNSEGQFVEVEDITVVNKKNAINNEPFSGEYLSEEEYNKFINSEYED